VKYRVRSESDYIEWIKDRKDYYTKNELEESLYKNLAVLGHKIYPRDNEVDIIVSDADFLYTQKNILAKELFEYDKLLERFDELQVKQMLGNN
jgi:DNA modification methylase